MTTGLVEKALKAGLSAQDCIEAAPMWENDGNYAAFISSIDTRISGLRWAILFGAENRKHDGCNVILRGFYRILIYAPPGTGRGASRDAADCLICSLAVASPVRVTDDDDPTLGLKLSFSENGQKPHVRRRFQDGHGRAVTEISVPFTAVTCKC